MKKGAATNSMVAQDQMMSVVTEMTSILKAMTEKLEEMGDRLFTTQSKEMKEEPIRQSVENKPLVWTQIIVEDPELFPEEDSPYKENIIKIMASHGYNKKALAEAWTVSDMPIEMYNIWMTWMIQDKCREEGIGRGRAYQNLYREMNNYLWKLYHGPSYFKPLDGIREVWEHRFVFSLLLNKEGDSRSRERLEKLVEKGYLDIDK